MKTLLTSILLLCAITANAQKKYAPLTLNNALIVSHLNKEADRYTLEIAVSDVLTRSKVKNMVSLNVLKQGGNPQILMSDSLTQVLQAKGINTLMLVSVRGFDSRFKPSSGKMTLADDLDADNLFPIYKEDISSVTFEFHFYREGNLVYTDMLRVAGVSSRDKLVKKLHKKLEKKVVSNWK
jgi:hypothetical protein